MRWFHRRKASSPSELARKLGIAHTQCLFCQAEMLPMLEGRYVGKPNPIIGLQCPKCGAETKFKKPIEGVWVP